MVKEVLKKNAILVTSGEASELGKQVYSPLVPIEEMRSPYVPIKIKINKNLPYVYLGFKTNGEIYIGLNTSTTHQGRDSFSSKTHKPGTS